MNPHPEGAKFAESGYIERFEAFAKDRGLRADYLAIPGDITNKATPGEFRLASAQIARVAAALSVPEDRILMVPGNHDIDWAAPSAGPSHHAAAQERYLPLQQDGCIFSSTFQRAVVNRITEPDAFCIWNTPSALVIGVNSAYHDGPGARVHHGMVPSSVISKLRSELGGYPTTNSQLRLALVHHHPIQYSDPLADLPDFSAMTNAGAFLEFLEDHCFDLVVHGHKHVPHFNVWQVSSYYQLPIVGAGSFSYLLDSRWNGVVSNQFHILEVHGRDPQTSRLKGVLRNFTYLCTHGWRESQPVNGIEHEIYFGGYSTEAALRAVLRQLIFEEFDRASYIRAHEKLLLRPELRYVASKLMTKTIRDLQLEIGFVVHGDSLDQMILLKE